MIPISMWNMERSITNSAGLKPSLETSFIMASDIMLNTVAKFYAIIAKHLLSYEVFYSAAGISFFTYFTMYSSSTILVYGHDIFILEEEILKYLKYN